MNTLKIIYIEYSLYHGRYPPYTLSALIVLRKRWPWHCDIQAHSIRQLYVGSALDTQTCLAPFKTLLRLHTQPSALRQNAL